MIDLSDYKAESKNLLKEESAEKSRSAKTVWAKPIQLRLSVEEKESLKKNADAMGLKLATFIRFCLKKHEYI